MLSTVCPTTLKKKNKKSFGAVQNPQGKKVLSKFVL